MIIAGTGSRSLITDPKLFSRVSQRLCAKLLDEKIDVAITGMAEGFDECLAYAALAAKVPYYAFVPNPGYGDYYWGRNSLTGDNRLSQFEFLLEHATQVQYTCTGLYLHGKHANFVRNEAMVDAADKLWVWDPTSRGTSQCFAYARSLLKPHEVITLDEEH